MSVTDRSFIRLSFIEPPYLLAVGFVLLGTFVSVGSPLISHRVGEGLLFDVSIKSVKIL